MVNNVPHMHTINYNMKNEHDLNSKNQGDELEVIFGPDTIV